MQNNLPKLRKQIDRLDDQIVLLLNRRMKLAESVGALKANNGHKVYDRAREQELLSRLCESLDGPLADRELCEIYKKILKVSREHQKKILKNSSR
jgi:monofunctional chorismate mutase